MPDEIRNEAVETETGFGTGLRAQIVERFGWAAERIPVASKPEAPPPDEPEEEPEPELLPAAATAEPQPVWEAPAGGSPDSQDVRALLRLRAEEQAEKVWNVFAEALEAVDGEGRPHHRTRLEAARALLGEAYADGLSLLPAREALDELAHRRELRRAE